MSRKIYWISWVYRLEMGETQHIGLANIVACLLSWLAAFILPLPFLVLFSFVRAVERESTLLASFIPDRRRAFNLCSRDPFVCSVLVLERFLFRSLLRGTSLNISKLLTRYQNCSLLCRSRIWILIKAYFSTFVEKNPQEWKFKYISCKKLVQSTCVQEGT